jgi:hypothetical protein
MRKPASLQFSLLSLVIFVSGVALLLGILRIVREGRWPIVVAVFLSLAALFVCRERKLFDAIISGSLGSGITAILVLWHFQWSSQQGGYLVMQLQKSKPPAYAGELIFQHFASGAVIGVVVWGVLWILQQHIGRIR